MRGFGWRRDLPDRRDYHYLPAFPPEKLPTHVDLRPFCPPVYDQMGLNSCSANAVAAAVEFDLMKERRERIIFPSRLFLYYNSRVMERRERSNVGVTIRDTIKSVARLGDCPESLWPYVEHKFAVRPPKECYKKAMKYKVVQYYRVHRDLNDLRVCLASGYPFVFGFHAHEKFHDVVRQTGFLQMPSRGEGVIGKHAVLAVGYNESHRRLLVRNSWGARFGLDGYFTMPYAYLSNGDLTADFWTVRVVS
jgi:C1A family cysteine protease